MATRKKTVEEITKANLSRTLNKLKIKVAEKEEIWLECLEWLVPLTLGEEETVTADHIARGARMADEVLHHYEERWGRSL